MSDMNKTFLQGRLTREPELRETSSGAKIVDLAVASNYHFKVADEWKQKTTYMKVTLWDKLAERFLKLLATGDEVLVVGRLVDDNFITDKQANLKTSGRVKIDDVESIQILKKAKTKSEDSSKLE